MRRCGRCGRRYPYGASCQTPACRAARAAFGRKRGRRVYDDPEYRRNRQAALERDGHQCTALVAGIRCTTTATNGRVTVDHVRPVAEGGGHGLENLATLCLVHQQQKTARENAVRNTARAARTRRLGGRGYRSS